MVNRPEDVLARFDADAVVQPGDREVIREALKYLIARPVFIPLDWDGWKIGQNAYPNWRGFEYLHKLVTHPGEQIHVHDLMHQPDVENSRKSVQKAIARAVDELLSTQPGIGEHLKSNVTTGEYCTYTGDWDWRVSP